MTGPGGRRDSDRNRFKCAGDIFRERRDSRLSLCVAVEVICSNGVVHIVDAVLMPCLFADQLTETKLMSIVETCQSVPELPGFVGALILAVLVNALPGQCPRT